MIGVIDYELGNVKSVTNALRSIGAATILSNDVAQLERCQALILPGVGAFETGMERLRKAELVSFLRSYIADNRPLLGICLGMQLLFDYSEEFGRSEGLGFFPGGVRKLSEFKAQSQQLRLPHVGWREIELNRNTDDYTFIDPRLDGKKMYFVHSYAVSSENNEHVIASSYYENTKFACIVAKQRVFGVQFHPEKSGEAGIKLIENFVDYSRR